MDLFDLLGSDFDFSSDTGQPPRMTADEFVSKAKALLEGILAELSASYESVETDEPCGRCGGFMFIEQGGEGDVDCDSCRGTGVETERKSNPDRFMTVMEEIIFEKGEFFDLINCEIEQNKTQNKTDEHKEGF